MRVLKLTYLLCIFLCSLQSLAIQTEKELLESIAHSEVDENKVQAYIKLGIYYYTINKTKLSKEAFQNAVNFASPDSSKARALNEIGDYFLENVTYENALEYRLQELKIRIRQNNLKELAGTHNNLAIIYNRLSNYEKSLEHHLKAIRLRKKINDKEAYSDSYLNMAFLYQKMNDWEAAEINYNKAIEVKEDINDSSGLATAYLNAGGLMVELKKQEKAINYLTQAVSLFNELKNHNLKGYAYVNLAYAYKQTKDFKQAYHFLNLANKIPNTNNYLKGGLLQGLGEISLDEGKYEQAIRYFNSAKEYHLKTTDVKTANIIDKYLSECYEKLGNYQMAIHKLERYTSVVDSLNELNNTKILSEIREKYESEQKEQEIMLQDSQINRQKKLRTFLLTSGLILTLILIFLLFNIKSRIQKNDLARAQKKAIEKEQKLTLDSIEYAKKIQQSFLPTIQSIEQNFKDFFILYKPRDIISGDFYWFHHTKEHIIFAAVDCTGHGVPGGLMSMLGNRLLNDIVTIQNTTKPNEILEKLHKAVVHDLKQNDKSMSQDGMDLFICTYYKKSNQLEYAGAKNKAYLINPAGEMVTLTTNLRSVGGTGKFDRNAKPFELFSIKITPESSLYLFSDGIIDQFGGEFRKKFGTKQFKELLNEIHELPMSVQKIRVEEKMKEWQAQHSQIDDMLLMGFKF